MHGVVFPGPGNVEHKSVATKVRQAVWDYRAFLMIVVLPTLLASIYYGLIASNQYESSADFVVRRAESASNAPDYGQILGFSIGSSAAVPDAYVVQQYLLSHDAVGQLRARNDLVGVFRRPGVDWLSRLKYANPAPEKLLSFYRRQISVEQDATSGITHLQVHTFRPADSLAIATNLLKMGEAQVNEINQRTYDDQMKDAKRQVDGLSAQLNDVEARLTAFRKFHDDIDPEGTGRAQISLVNQLTANLVAARAKLRTMDGVVSPNSPQYVAMARQLHALEAQVGQQSAKIAASSGSVASRLGDYEKLVIKREQIAKSYAVAAAQYQQTQADSKRKRLYLVHVVNPNMPVKSEFPKRFASILTVFVALLFAYAIGWLLWAGVKEHSL